jgi:hypothetical protein
MAPPQVPPFQQLLQLREPIAEPDENPTAGGVGNNQFKAGR